MTINLAVLRDMLVEQFTQEGGLDDTWDYLLLLEAVDLIIKYLGRNISK